MNLEDDGEGYAPVNSPNLAKAWTNTKASPDAIFTDFKPSEASSSSGNVSFYPVERKGVNYLRYCTGWLSANEKSANIRDCIRRYTSESGWFCTTINLALATDSPDLQTHGEYIKHLKYSIGMSPMNYSGTVYRG
ncbi:unnamed protein product [Rotaria sp. Silwood2]|nr:unnamed protein product [Rotaria sp. Silwood2]CAF4481031.1 unnamed protein product [Rotaria sp. Silwood2]